MKRTHLLDNLQIKTKLIFIYMFCVLIPLFMTNVIIISLIKRQATEKQQQDLNKQLEMVEYDLTGLINNGMNATKNVYLDSSMNNLLNKKYDSPYDYYVTYEDISKRNNTRYYYSAQKIYDITIYADNDTILDGGNLAKLSGIRDTEWYKAFNSQEFDTMAYVYYDMSKKFIQLDYARKVSLIRKLTYYGREGVEKLIKIDFNYNEAIRQLSISQMVEDVYICNHDYVIFHNKEQNVGHKEFVKTSEIDFTKATARRVIDMFHQKWTIYVFAEKITISGSIQGTATMLFVLILINLMLPTTVIIFVNKSLRNRIMLTEKYLRKVKHGIYESMECTPGKDEIGGLIHNYNTMVAKIKDLINVVYREKMEKQELEISKKQAELAALHSQINPHFMFNTLESIRMRGLIKGEEETAEAIGQLAILMRKSIQWGNDTITIKEELEFVQAYLFIQKYRFGDKLKFQLHVKEECLSIRVPKLTIVTFVENSCVHGIEKITRQGMISLTISASNESLFIEISDTGGGMSEEQLILIREKMQFARVALLNNAKAVGILNACIRLKNYTKNSTIFEIDSTEGVGTDITIQIPLDLLEGVKSGVELEDEND